MTEQEAYDAVSSLLASISDRAAELSDEQHLCVMEAINDFGDIDRSPLLVLRVAETFTMRGLLSQTADALACLIDASSDGAESLRYANIHARLMSSLAA